MATCAKWGVVGREAHRLQRNGRSGKAQNVCDIAPAPAIRPRRIPSECLNPQRDRIPWRQYLNLKQAKTDQESHKTLRDVGDEKKSEKNYKNSKSKIYDCMLTNETAQFSAGWTDSDVTSDDASMTH